MKNKDRCLIVVCLLLFTTQSIAQDPTKEETIHWLHHIFSQHTYYTDNEIHQISFMYINDSLYISEHIKRHKDDKVVKDFEYLAVVHPKDIKRIKFEAFEGSSTYLYFFANSAGKFNLTPFRFYINDFYINEFNEYGKNYGPLNTRSSFWINVSPRILEDDKTDRIEKAISHLVSLYGGRLVNDLF